MVPVCGRTVLFDLAADCFSTFSQQAEKADLGNIVSGGRSSGS
jgi:hypothetical protein